MRYPNFRPKPMALAMAALAAALAAPASANPLLSASSAATAGGTAGTENAYESGTPVATYKGSSTYADQPAGSANASSFANSGGAYAVRSSAQGMASGSSVTSLSYTFENTGVAQGFSMSFHLYGGAIGSYLNVSSLDSGESLLASYAASIKVNGISRFATGASLERNDSTIVLSKTGTSLSSDDGSDGVYNWSSADFVIDLGFLNTGDTVNILAELQGASTANVGTYAFDSCGNNGYGGYEGYGGYDSTCFKGNSFVSYGDPIDIFGDGSGGEGATAPIGQAAITRNAVPEPGALALVGLALAGLALTSRRRPR